MKRIASILIILYFCMSGIYSQNLSKMTISSHDSDNIPVNVCKDGKLGIVVFYSAIKNLEFEALSPSTGGSAIVNVIHNISDNCYILCVQPQKETNFSVKISANKFYPETYEVGSLGAKEKKLFTIYTDENTVEITVLDKDGKPLDNSLLEIKGKPIERTNSNGFSKIELPDSQPTTLFITHRLYEDQKAINVRPGDNQRVQLYRLKPAPSTSKELTFIFRGLENEKKSSVKVYIGNQFIGETNYSKGFQFKHIVDTKLASHELRVVWEKGEWKGVINSTSQTNFIFECRKIKDGFGITYKIDLIK